MPLTCDVLTCSSESCRCCHVQVLAAVDKSQLYGEPKIDVFQL